MAIAFDNSTNLGTVTAESLTAAHTCTGTDRILFVQVRSTGTTDNISGVTYNGVAMARVGAVVGTTNLGTFLYVLVAPATGANNVVVSATASITILAVASSYTGAKQTGQPDASNTNTNASTTGLTTSVTTVAGDCWGVLAVNTGAGNTLAGTGSFLRQQGDNTGIVFFDTNASLGVPASESMAFTCDSGAAACVMASFSPAVQQIITMPADVGVFTLTGVDVTLRRGKVMIAEVGHFVLTGIDAVLRFRGWQNQSKSSTTFSNSNKSSTTFSNENKSSTNWTNEDKTL